MARTPITEQDFDNHFGLAEGLVNASKQQKEFDVTN